MLYFKFKTDCPLRKSIAYSIVSCTHNRYCIYIFFSFQIAKDISEKKNKQKSEVICSDRLDEYRTRSKSYYCRVFEEISKCTFGQKDTFTTNGVLKFGIVKYKFPIEFVR